MVAPPLSRLVHLLRLAAAVARADDGALCLVVVDQVQVLVALLCSLLSARCPGPQLDRLSLALAENANKNVDELRIE